MKTKGLGVVRRRYLYTGLLGLILAVLPLFVTNAYYMHTLVMILFYAYIATSWNLVGGYAGQLSMGHAAFLTIGGYVSGLLYNYAHLTPWIGMLVGGAAAALIAFVLGIPSFRLRGSYYSISTIAFAQGLMIILTTLNNIGPYKTGGAEGLRLGNALGKGFFAMNFLSKVPYYYIILAFLAVLILIVFLIEHSRLGYSFVALRENEDAAKAAGINTQRTKLIAAALSAFFTGIGGMFYGQLIRYYEPNSICGIAMSTQMVFLAIVGGTGTVLGPMLGAVLLTALSTVAQMYMGGTTSGLHLIIYGVAVILTIMFMPSGKGLIHLVTRALRIDDDALYEEQMRLQGVKPSQESPVQGQTGEEGA